MAHPHAGDKTIVVGLDDSTPGQVYVYVGDKKSNGNAVERAGLVGGRLSGIQVQEARGIDIVEVDEEDLLEQGDRSFTDLM